MTDHHTVREARPDDHGATVARNMVFDWNSAGMAQSRTAGLQPVTAFRWAYPDPDDTARRSTTQGLTIREDADAAWRYWTHGDTREALDGLAVGDGCRGLALRGGIHEREGETFVDYPAAALARTPLSDHSVYVFATDPTSRTS